jgi:[Skp1-protein]-hydroxyproline N-acetylglucosaminyltransferase
MSIAAMKDIGCTPDDDDADPVRRDRRRLERYRERKQRWSSSSSSSSSSSRRTTESQHSRGDLSATTPFLVLLALLAVALALQFIIVFGWHHRRHDERVLGRQGGSGGGGRREYDPKTAHLTPRLPPLPPILNVRQIPNAEVLIDDVMSGQGPTVAGIALVLSRFLDALRESNKRLASRGPPHRVQRDEVHESFARLAKESLAPLEDAYRDRLIFPVRDDDSIFVSLASFRDHLLGNTLVGAFDQARHPDRLFVGVVVQNCLGLDPYPGESGSQCRTGAQVVGKGPNGRDKTKVSDAPPDRNGVEEFCTSPNHKKYCDSGQVRALYLHEDESLGPAMARYYASKLWGGESYFVQVDSHLEFYEGWDELYINELKATRSFPKSMLSSYPPGFYAEEGGMLKGEPSTGARLCTCEFSDNDVEDHIIRINSGKGYNGDEEAPTQIPFVAAGFFFAPARFLLDVPFDPYLPWCFMGEEIMLSMRAWTHGWDIVSFFFVSLILTLFQFSPIFIIIHTTTTK